VLIRVEIPKAYIVGQSVGKILKARGRIGAGGRIHEADLRTFLVLTAEFAKAGKGLRG
jgi:hypothetical protein